MNLFRFSLYMNLILLIIFDNLQIGLTRSFLSRNSISLYNETDKLTVLTSENLTSTIYHSKTAWLVQFYASWCGHCQSYAKIYREIGIDTWAWKSVVRIGAINCVGGNNTPTCRAHGVRGYPTILLFPSQATFNQSKVTHIPATDAKNVENEIIKGLENFNLRNSTWPRFIPVNRITIEELYFRLPKSTKLLLIIIEKRDDFTGRQIMLDFSKYQSQISIFRTTIDGKLWRKFPINNTDIPALFVILRNRTIQRIDHKQNSLIEKDYRSLFRQTIQTYISEKKLIENWTNDIDIRKEIITIENKPNLTNDDNRDRDTIHRRIHLLDLELALSYMFRHEIPLIEDIRNDAYASLKQWLHVLIKYFPGREPMIMHLKFILSKLAKNSQGLTGNQFREIFDLEPTKAFFPNDREQYQHCSGSSPQYRGYPCALWILFHTLTVSQYQIETQNSNSIDVFELPSAIQNYIKHFFSCRKCSEHFLKETKDINQLNLTNKQEAILYFWKIHNNVNQRLSFDVTEDPQYPKVQFPSRYLCSTCRSNDNKNEFHLLTTMNFLLNYYSKENFDRTNPMFKDDLSEYLFSKGNQIEFLSYRPGFFTRILQRYSMFIFVSFVILIIVVRRRYCRTKGKRYTL